MHELSIARNIVAIVAEAAGDRRVQRVTLEIGRLSGVLPDAIAFCYDVAVEGTVLHAAQLEIRMIDGRARCNDCDTEFAIQSLFDRCACGSARLTRLAGEELNVKSMELMEAA